MPTYRGSCHCGDVSFEVTGEIQDLVVCNCSICSRTAYLHWYVPPEQFRLMTSEDAFETYQFGTMTSKNHFCRRCGISPFRTPRSDPSKVDINLRCLEGVEVDAWPVTEFDGRNWEEAIKDR